MKHAPHRSLVALVLGFAISPADLHGQDAPLPPGVHRVRLHHPDDAAKCVEVFWTAPESGAPAPAILYVHGHQFGVRPGAKCYVDSGGGCPTAD